MLGSVTHRFDSIGFPIEKFGIEKSIGFGIRNIWY